jgi:serine/threonine protein kinase
VIQVPGYLIKREVGVGGMATVYLAVQTSLEREVALKVMNPSLVTDPNFSRRFLMEARTLASLSHPNIVAVYDVGVTDSQLHYFSMQHLPGGDFVQRIKDGPPTQNEVVRVLGGVAKALGFAHVRGFVHRDVSPANILFDSSENPVLTDFGIARAVTRTSRLTNAGVSVGTSHYMSPEQARGGNVDARSDIYSLGAVAFEALTGKPPYDGEDGFAIAYAHVFEPVPRLPTELVHWQPLIDQALAKHPNDRFADLDGFLAALDKVAESIGAPPVTQNLRAVPAAAEVPKASPPVELPARPVERTAVSPAPNLPIVEPATAPSPSVPPSVPVRAAVQSRPFPRWIPALAVIVLGLAGLGWALWNALSGPPDNKTAQTSNSSATVAANHSAATTPASNTASTPAVEPSANANDLVETSIDATQSDVATLDAQSGEVSPAQIEDIADYGGDVEAVPAPDEQQALREAMAQTVVDPLNLVLALARNDLAGKRLTVPPGRNALERFRLAQSLAQHFRASNDLQRATQGIVDTANAYFTLAEEALAKDDLAQFLEFMKQGEAIAQSLPEGAPLAKAAMTRRTTLRDQALSRAQAAVRTWDKAAAMAGFERALQLEPGNKTAQAGLKAAQRLGDPGYVFRDALQGGGNGPEMVVLKLGGKRIGFARQEATVGEFSGYWNAAGRVERGAERPSCRDRESFFRSSRKYTFDAPNFAQTADHPVVCVSWGDAEAYAKWLSARTGQRYRLPTAAEWRAVAQGATKAAPCRANLADSRFNASFRERDALTCDDGYATTAPVRRFEATATGVYDMGGNVREWVSDCAENCREHLAFGSAWLSTSDQTDVLQSKSFGLDVAANTLGFRLVRDID